MEGEVRAVGVRELQGDRGARITVFDRSGRRLSVEEDGQLWKVGWPPSPPWPPQRAPDAYHADAFRMQGRARSPGLAACPITAMAHMAFADSEKCFRLRSLAISAPQSDLGRLAGHCRWATRHEQQQWCSRQAERGADTAAAWRPEGLDAARPPPPVRRLPG